ncbi:MAG TPA: hypothetical protein VL240_07760 [Candidatus Binatia bacterium]|nr:hypothetical protein [Candidatus Binatia bacterium]
MKERKLSRRARLELLFRSADDESLLGFTLYDEWNDDWRWAQKECLKRLQSDDQPIRRAALWGLSVLALRKHLEPEIVIPKLQALLDAEPAVANTLKYIYQNFPAFRPKGWKDDRFEPTERSRGKLARMLQSDDEQTVCVALWDAANYEEDWRWVQAECLKRLKSSKELQYGALVGLNYLALRGELEPDVVLFALQEIEHEWTAYIRENIYRFWKPQ